MRRRDFIKGITVSTTWPIAAHAQQIAKTHRIALVHPSAPIADMSESGGNPNYPALFKELRRLGYIEGVNLVITRYSGEGQEERFPELCREIVRTKPDVIVTASTRLVLSFKAATDTIPIVGAMGDPVPVGIVANIARPEGNITGVSSMAGSEIWASACRSCAKLSRRHRKWGSLVRVSYGAWRQQTCCGKLPSNRGSLFWAHPLKARSKAKNIAAHWRRWRRNMLTRSSSVITQKTSPTGNLLLIWCGTPSCQRFFPFASILKLGRSWRTVLRPQIFTADLGVTLTRF